MKPLRVRSVDQPTVFTTDIGRVLRREQLPKDLDDTVLDPAVLQNGAAIHLPKGPQWRDVFDRPIDHIELPPLSTTGRCEETADIVFLHPASLAFNEIILGIQENLDFVKIQRMIARYQMELVLKIMGGRGILATGVAGTRMPHSGRLVLIPSVDRHPGWVGISKSAMARAGVKENDLVIVFRDPVIWIGSVEVLKAYPVEEEAICLHPLLYDQFAADNDGDQMAFVKPSYKVPGVRQELEQQFLGFAKRHATWPQRLCPIDPLDGKPLPSEVNWDDILEDTRRRFLITGLSYGPRDVQGWKNVPSAAKMLEYLAGSENPDQGVKFTSRNRDISRGQGDVVWDLLKNANRDNVFMKRYLGVVGATARRIVLVMGTDPWLRMAANNASNIIQQETLDAKHTGAAGRAFSPVDVLEMFELRGPWRNASPEACVDLLVQCGVNDEDARRLIMYHRVEMPLRLALEANVKSPENRVKAEKAIRDCIRGEDGNARKGYNLAPALEAIQVAMIEEGVPKVTPRRVFAEAQRFRMGLLAMVRAFYPGFAGIGKSVTGDYEKSLQFYEALFQRGTKDRGGLFDFIDLSKEVPCSLPSRQDSVSSPSASA